MSSRSWLSWPNEGLSPATCESTGDPMSRTALDRPWYPPGNPTGLTELEVASGMVVGRGDGGPLPRYASPDPMAALRDE